MFHDIPQAILERMHELEAKDAADRADGTPMLQRLRQVEPEVGRFLALLAASAPRGRWIEIGTSAGYSTLWLSLACREAGARITTFEILPEKAALARATFGKTGVGDVVELVVGDALEQVQNIRDVAFCFLDAEKDVYERCYEAVIPGMAAGGLLVADNAISHAAELRPMIERALHDERVDAMVVPIGRGELLCRRR